jgi:hypothetical protein
MDRLVKRRIRYRRYNEILSENTHSLQIQYHMIKATNQLIRVALVVRSACRLTIPKHTVKAS